MGVKNFGECKFVLYFGYFLIFMLIMVLLFKVGKFLLVVVILNFIKKVLKEII